MKKEEIMEKESGSTEVVDGSDIKKLVENEEVFTNYVHHKFNDLDIDCDGKLSVQELQPAILDIGSALGLPPEGTSPNSDHIYSEVLNEFTHGTTQQVSKNEFKQVFSDILVGMADGLNREPVVILRMDGDELLQFIKSPSFEPEMVSIFSEINHGNGSLREFIVKAFDKIHVNQGMPPTSDPWVMSNVVEAAIQSCGSVPHHQPVSQETFLVEFKGVVESVAHRLREQPVVVAHSENKFDGSGIRRILSNKFELDKTLEYVVKGFPKDHHGALEYVVKGFPKDHHGAISMEYLRVAIDIISPSASLPPVGAVHQMDEITTDALKMFGGDDKKLVKEDEFKKLVTEILWSIMLQLEGNPISVSTNSVLHEPVASSSTLFQSSST